MLDEVGQRKLNGVVSPEKFDILRSSFNGDTDEDCC